MAAVTTQQQDNRTTPVLVSACLLDLSTRYDGGSCRRDRIIELAGERMLVPVCPEQLGGLPTPRPPVEIRGGDGGDVLQGRASVVSTQGRDVTTCFRAGAERTLQIAGLCGACEAWLKEGSPSCGVDSITRADARTPGSGVTAALLRAKGIRVVGID
jgi:uncharacterized protein YbbK (DUF523 family)